MQIKIRHFGPIKEFNFDLKKDLVVIFGQNNLGKSYAIYIVYLLIKTGLNLSQRGATEPEFLAEFQAAFLGTFDQVENIKSRFSRQPMRLTWCNETSELVIEVKDQKLTLSNVTLLKYLQNSLDLDGVKQVYYLPAARFSIYQALSAFSAVFAELSKCRNVLRQKVEIPTLSVPVSDYFLGLSEIKKNSFILGNQEILGIVDEIERKILKGEVIFNTELRKFFYQPYHQELCLDFSLTSSMVSELFPLVAYLKYIVA